MNGGRVKWLNEPDKPLTTDDRTVTPTTYTGCRRRSGSCAPCCRDVLEAVASGAVANLVDVRSPDEFTGKVIAPPGMNETAQRGGHIPGAEKRPLEHGGQPGRHLQDPPTSCAASTWSSAASTRPTTRSPTAASASAPATPGSC